MNSEVFTNCSCLTKSEFTDKPVPSTQLGMTHVLRMHHGSDLSIYTILYSSISNYLHCSCEKKVLAITSNLVPRVSHLTTPVGVSLDPTLITRLFLPLGLGKVLLKYPFFFYLKPSNKVFVFQNIDENSFMTTVNFGIFAQLCAHAKKTSMILVTKLFILSVFSWFVH